MLFTQRTSLTMISSILILGLFLFGGGGLTAHAASAALPGDTLYPVKTGLENAQAGLTTNSETQARLFLGFAGRRLEEIRALIADGRLDQVNETANRFEQEIQKALDAIQKLSGRDPAQAAALNAEAVKILKGYSNALNAMLAGTPKDVQPVLQNALNVSESAMAIGNVNDDNSNADLDNDNGNLNDDDSNANLNENHDIVNDDNSNNNLNDQPDNDENGNTNLNEDHGSVNNDNSNSNLNNEDGNNTNINNNSGDSGKKGNDSGNGGNSNGSGDNGSSGDGGSGNGNSGDSGSGHGGNDDGGSGQNNNNSGGDGNGG